jgi:hypothetical protein
MVCHPELEDRWIASFAYSGSRCFWLVKWEDAETLQEDLQFLTE